MRLTRYHFAHEIAKECEGIVERWANVLRTGRLEANRGVDTACFAVDIRRDHIICNDLGPFHLALRRGASLISIQQVFLLLF